MLLNNPNRVLTGLIKKEYTYDEIIDAYDKRINDSGSMQLYNEIIKEEFIQYHEEYLNGEMERNIHPELLKLFTPGNPMMPGYYYLQRVVNRQLMTHSTTPRLLWDTERRLQLFITPSSLIGALWLQFATAIEGDRKYRTCDHCHNWFEKGAKVRADAKFCSSNCRQKAYRRNQAEARELSEKGMPASQIARRLGSEIKTVKGWIK